LPLKFSLAYIFKHSDSNELIFFSHFEKRFGLCQKIRFYVSVFLTTAQLFFPIKTFPLDSLQKNANNAFLKFIADGLSHQAVKMYFAVANNMDH